MTHLQHNLVNVLYTIKGLIEGHMSRAGEEDAVNTQNAAGRLTPPDAVLQRIYPQVVRAMAITRRIRLALNAQSCGRRMRLEVSVRKAWLIALKILQQRRRFKNVELIEHIPDEFPDIHCSRRDLIEILYCLAANAVEACLPTGQWRAMGVSGQPSAGSNQQNLVNESYRLKAEDCKLNAPKLILRVSLGYRSDEEPVAHITLADTGPGIPERTLNRLFEPFFTTKSLEEGLPAGAQAEAGNGLGLCLVKALVRKNNGTISASSFPGSGTTFTLTFPVASKSSVKYSHPERLAV